VNNDVIRSISKVARELDISVETVRFYERRGLIDQPLKPGTGYRHYPDDTVKRIRFIRRSQELGFSLGDIALLLSLNDNPCGQVQTLAENKLDSVRGKIKDLRHLEKALKELLVQCQSNEDDSRCPIIERWKL